MCIDSASRNRKKKVQSTQSTSTFKVSFQVCPEAHFHHSATQQPQQWHKEMEKNRSVEREKRLKCDTSVNFPQLQKRSSNRKLIAVHVKKKRHCVPIFFLFSTCVCCKSFSKSIFDMNTPNELTFHCGRLN